MDATILGHVMRAPLCRCFPSLFIVNWTYFEGGKLLIFIYKEEKIHLVHFVYRIFNSFALCKPTWLYRLQKKCLKTICVVRQVDVFPSVFIVNWAYFEGAKLLYLHI